MRGKINGMKEPTVELQKEEAQMIASWAILKIHSLTPPKLNILQTK